MPSYDQWFRATEKGQVARVAWLCGDQPVLVEEVIETTKRVLNISEFDFFHFSAETDRAVDIWDAAYQYSLDPEANRLVLVRQADHVKDWSPLDNWLTDSRHMVNTYLLFVSDEADYPTLPESKGTLQHHVERIRSKGKTIKCSMPNEHELTEWVQRNSKFKEQTAKFLVARAGSNLAELANICRKSMNFKDDPGNQAVTRLIKQYANQDFATSLIFFDKKSALLELEKLNEADYPKILSNLYARLDLLHTLNKALPNFSTYKELCEATGLKIFLVQKYAPVAKKYTASKLQSCRNAVTVVDDAVQRNATTGAMELLIELW